MPFRRSPARFFRGLLLAGLIALPGVLWAAAIKLCMKDGSYQMVSSYAVQGDRVRYYSVERSEWEEVPTALVDFDATKRAGAEAQSTEKKNDEEAREIDQERFYKPPSTGMEVAPGLRLPGDDGIFTVDKNRVVRLVQSASETVTDKKRAAMVLAIPLPVLKMRSLVVLEGPKSTIRLDDPLPTFYVQSSDGLGTRLELVRLKQGKETRVVEEVDLSRSKNGKPTEERTMLPVERRRLAPNLYSIKPMQPLAAAEYALGEEVDEKLNLNVYDFGYDQWETVK